MFRALDKIVNEFAFGPHERKVKKYLNESTTDSVLKDLQKALAPRVSEAKSLWTTFDNYCVEDSSQQRCWDNNSFRSYVKKVHPNVAVSEPEIQLLWRCFSFYAYHPFSRSTIDKKIDPAAFQRAVALLVVQGTDLLGMQDGGEYPWRDDVTYFHRTNFERVFRSIGLPENAGKRLDPLDYDADDTASIVEAVMDVLAMTQPYSIQLAPSPDQLRFTARKLLGEDALQKRYRTARRDFSTLLSLLLRLRLRETKGRYEWGSRFHSGTIEIRDPGDDEMADILVRALGGSQDEDILTSGQTTMAMDLLPNLQLRFHQLWAVIFQQPMTAEDEPPSQIPGAVPNHILATISLIIPQPKVSYRSQPTSQEMRICLEHSSPPSQRPNDLNAIHLVHSITQDPHPHVILLTSNATGTKPLTVMGSCFPSPLSNPGGEQRQLVSKTPHFLFQLRPQLQLHRWNGPHIPLAKIITIDDETPLLGAVAVSNELSLATTKPYRIGGYERKGAALCIDPETKSATLRSNTTNTDSGLVVGYEPVYIKGKDSDKEIASNREVAIQIDHFDVFRVMGAIDADVDYPAAKNQYRYVHDATEEKIKGEELSKRIQGFGSTSL